MTARPKTSEAKSLELARLAIENTENQTQIATSMAEYGYGPDTMAVGRALYQSARLAFDSNKTETDESEAAFIVFDAKRTQLEKMYSDHRKKAKVVFNTDPITANRLGILGAKPQAYANWVETVRKFYNTSVADAEIQAKLTRLKITEIQLNTGLELLAEMESLRTAYFKEKGESQDATALKDAALAKLDDWMGEFVSYARIALEDHPQLLESLGITV